jgi:hypothetical protein
LCRQKRIIQLRACFIIGRWRIAKHTQRRYVFTPCPCFTDQAFEIADVHLKMEQSIDIIFGLRFF